MIFRIINKLELRELFDVMSENRIIGPVQKGTSCEGKPLYAFEPVIDFDDLKLDYTTTTRPAKRYFLPSHETLCTFSIHENGWDKSVDFNIHEPHVFFGMHACDINALDKLDKVLMESNFPRPIMRPSGRTCSSSALNAIPSRSASAGPWERTRAFHGFDMFLTDIGDRYFVEVQSADGL